MISKCQPLSLGLALVVMGLALTVPQAFAGSCETETGSAAFQTCIDKAQGVTSGTIECIGIEFKRVDGLLNATYARTLKTLAPDQQDKLRKAQRTWITYRDQNCDTWTGEGTGSLQRVLANNCMLDMTVNRTKELDAFNLN